MKVAFRKKWLGWQKNFFVNTAGCLITMEMYFFIVDTRTL